MDTSEGPAVAREVRVHGRVQGVFFRDSCRSEARSRNVTGWVRNDPGGTVSAYFEGSVDAVQAMVDWSRTGPPHARVDSVDVTDRDPEGGTDFLVR
jgi:acylphosphatase